MIKLKPLKIAANKKSLINKSILKLFSLILCFSFCLFHFVVSINPIYAAENNIAIPNSSFESITQKSSWGTTYTYPTDWTLTSIYSVSISNEYSISGNSVKINKNSSFTLSSAKFSANNGDYTFGFFCYAENAPMQAEIHVSILNSSGSASQTFTSQSYQIKSGIWQEITVDVSLEQALSELQITIITNNQNTACYIDEVFAKYNVKQSTVSTLDGATMRLNVNNPGIRFRGSVDKEFYDQCVENYSDVSAGMLFTVKNNLQGLSDFTVEELSKNNKVYKEITAAIWNNPDTIDSDGFYGFNCAIVNIKDHNIGKTYCARSYVKYTHNGVVKYVYGEFSYSNNARTIIDIANAALESDKTFSDKIIEILEHFAFYGQTN